MQKGGSFIPTPAFPLIVKEITERLLGDDWYRVCTGDGTRKYYIVGAAEHAAELSGEAVFDGLQVPTSTKTGPLAEWAVRSQLADNKPAEFLNHARKNLERAGVVAAVIDRFIAGHVDDLSGWTFDENVTRDERVRLLSSFFEAVRLAYSDQTSLQLDRDEEAEADRAREKLCLENVAKRYSKIVDRWEQLERLPFDDPQLEEASKTYLYGFYRAAVVLCASAVETELRHALTSVAEGSRTFDLVQAGEESRLIDRADADHARDLFRYRNRVAHDNAEPEADKAKVILAVARRLVSNLRSRLERQ